MIKTMSNIPVYIINLNHSIKRRRYMQKLCKKYNFNYEFIDAIDGNTLREEEIASIYLKDKIQEVLGREMSRGEVGAWLSHKSIYEKMVRDNIDIALVLEDDVVFDGFLSEVLDHVENFPKYWNFILLGHHPLISRKKETLYSFWDQHKMDNSHKLVRPRELAVGAYGYMLKNSAAKILLNQLEKIKCPIDHLTGSDEKLNLYAMIPPVVMIHDDLSDNYHNMHDRKELQEKLRKEKGKEKKTIVYSKKRKLLIVFRLDKIWDNINLKRIALIEYVKVRRRYK